LIKLRFGRENRAPAKYQILDTNSLNFSSGLSAKTTADETKAFVLVHGLGF